MAWVTIPPTATDPDAPLTSFLAKAWSDNPAAIANGDAGAPRIRHTAFLAPVSGTAFFVGDASVSVTSSGTSTTIPLVGRCLTGGVVSYEITASIGTGSVSLLLGETVVKSLNTSGTESGNVTVPYGGRLYLRVTPPTAGNLRGSATITCGNDAPRIYT